MTMLQAQHMSVPNAHIGRVVAVLTARKEMSNHISMSKLAGKLQRSMPVLKKVG